MAVIFLFYTILVGARMMEAHLLDRCFYPVDTLWNDDGWGDNDTGTIFKMDLSGSGFALLHEFASYASDRATPQGSLTLLDSTLFGMTMYGGDYDMGMIFKIDVNGTGFTLLHSFAGGVDDGAYPKGSLLLSGSTLFGMTSPDDAYSNIGTLFKIGIWDQNSPCCTLLLMEQMMGQIHLAPWSFRIRSSMA